MMLVLFSNRLLTEWPGESRPAQLLCNRQQTKSFKYLHFYNIHNNTLFNHQWFIISSMNFLTKIAILYHMICKSLYLYHSRTFRQGARKLGVKVNIVSHNLGTEIRNELRSEQNICISFSQLFLNQLWFNAVMWSSIWFHSHQIHLDLRILI